MSATAKNKIVRKYHNDKDGQISIEDTATTNNNMYSETRGTTPVPPENRKDKTTTKELKRP